MAYYRPGPSALEVGSPPLQSDDWGPQNIAGFFDGYDTAETQDTNLVSSFARDFYRSSGPELDGDFLLSNGSDKLPKPDPFARALERMHFLTDSQAREVLENCGLEVIKSEGKEAAILKIMIWRDEKGDFTYTDEDDDAHEDGTVDGCIHDDERIMMLPLYMKDVTEATMQYGLLKPDLQLECLLRSIPYEGSDTKAQLISKLMHFKDTLFSNSNTLQLLEEQARSSA